MHWEFKRITMYTSHAATFENCHGKQEKVHIFFFLIVIRN